MTDRKIELTRRKALLGLGTIGLAGAGAGVGTSALFSDEESFNNNTIQAGELDLYVSASSTYSGPSETNLSQDVELTDGSNLPMAFYELTDVKPGDSGTAEICFSSVDNPAWIWTQGVVTANDENGQTEPEQAVDTTTGAGAGELAGTLESSLVVDAGNDGSTTEVFGDLFSGHFSPWQLLDGDGGDGQFTASDSAGEDHCITLDWELPKEVGNEVQSDTLTFGIALYAEQYRNNGGYASQDVCYRSPQNPTANGPAGSQPDFNTDQVLELCIDYEASGGELETVTYNIDLDEPWSDPSEPNANVAIGFCGTQDHDGASLPLEQTADYQIAWSSSDGFRYRTVQNENSQSATWGSWMSLSNVPGISASKSGTEITITSDVDTGFPYDPGDVYGLVVNSSYGGATHANISSDPANSWSSALNWTSAEYFLPTKIPESV